MPVPLDEPELVVVVPDPDVVPVPVLVPVDVEPVVAPVPDDPVGAAEFASTHPLRQEVRIVAGATRAGATYCALRMRSHDDDQSVVGGIDLVPELLELLASTLEDSTLEEDG